MGRPITNSFSFDFFVKVFQDCFGLFDEYSVEPVEVRGRLFVCFADGFLHLPKVFIHPFVVHCCEIGLVFLKRTVLRVMWRRMNKRQLIGGALVAVVVFLAVVVYVPAGDISYLHSAIFGPFTVTVVTTTTVVTVTSTELNNVMGQVTACSWNHASDRIEFTISATRTPSAPTDGKVLLLYIPNQHIYGPGGLFVFGSGSTTVVTAVASDSGFDRSRACIPSEWNPVFVE